MIGNIKIMVYNEQDIEEYVVDCPQCGTENTTTNNSCTNCNQDIRTKFCPKCNTLNYHNENQCQNCNYKFIKIDTTNIQIENDIYNSSIHIPTKPIYFALLTVGLIILISKLIEPYYPYVPNGSHKDQAIFGIVFIIAANIVKLLSIIYNKIKKINNKKKKRKKI